MVFRFYKSKEGRWYIDLPSFISEGGKASDLAMVAGMNDLLDEIAKEQIELKLNLLSREEATMQADHSKYVCAMFRVENSVDQVGLGMEYILVPDVSYTRFITMNGAKSFFKTERVWLCDAMRYALFGEYDAKFPEKISIFNP